MRERVVSPVISARLAPENHPEHEADAERRHDCFGRVFAHVLLGVVLKCAHAIARIAPGLFGLAAGIVPDLLGFAAIFIRNRARRRSQVLGCFACVRLAALEFVLRASGALCVLLSSAIAILQFEFSL